jgi:hypothetical protein
MNLGTRLREEGKGRENGILSKDTNPAPHPVAGVVGEADNGVGVVVMKEGVGPMLMRVGVKGLFVLCGGGAEKLWREKLSGALLMLILEMLVISRRHGSPKAAWRRGGPPSKTLSRRLMLRPETQLRMAKRAKARRIVVKRYILVRSFCVEA